MDINQIVMTLTEEQELAEAVLLARGYGFRPALEAIKPVVERMLVVREEKLFAANLLLRDYGRILMNHANAGGCHGGPGRI